MNTGTLTPRTADAASDTLAWLFRALRLEALNEWRSLARMPAFTLPTLLFPLGFYLMFAVVLPFAGTDAARATVLVNFIVFGVLGPGLFAFGVGLATDREQGWLRLKRTAPLPLSLMLLARVLVAMGFALAIVGLLFTAAVLLGGVRLEPRAWLALAAVAVAGVVPASAVGMAMGAWLHARAAVAVVNIVYLGSVMLSGLWFPLELMPAAVRSLAPALAPHQLAALGKQAVGLDAFAPALPLAGLVLLTLLSLALALIGLRRPGAR